MFSGAYVFKCAPRDRVECTRVILAIVATDENDGEKDNQGERAEFVGAAPASGCVKRARVETSGTTVNVAGLAIAMLQVEVAPG